MTTAPRTIRRLCQSPSVARAQGGQGLDNAGDGHRRTSALTAEGNIVAVQTFRRQATEPTALRVFRGELRSDPPRKLSPRLKVREFFDRWYLPVVLEGDKDASVETVKIYREALAWWETLTDNPGAEEIDEFTISELKKGLRTATYARSPRAGANRYQVSDAQQSKILRHLRAVLFRLGPGDARRPGKGLLSVAPYLAIPAAKQTRKAVKPPFSLAEARRIYAAADDLAGDVGALPAPVFWRRLLAILFYTGLRIGTVWNLRGSMLKHADGHLWLDVPAAAVSKTEKPILKFVHPFLAALLPAVGPDEPLIAWPHVYSWLRTRHLQLQTAAGLGAAQRLSPHAWRRTHATEISMLGCDRALAAAATALDHADGQTTRDHYVDPAKLDAAFVAKLPPLAVKPPVEDRQRQLF